MAAIINAIFNYSLSTDSYVFPSEDGEIPFWVVEEYIKKEVSRLEEVG